MSKEKYRPFVKVEEGVPPAGYNNPSVRYFDKKGNLLVRYEGTKAWRCNNPGNIKYVKGGFAVFPNEFAGRVALMTRLKKGEFPTYTLSKFAEVWEPTNIANYKRMLLDISGLPLEKKIKDLTTKEFECFRITIERIEGWKAGWEEFYPAP